MRECDQHSEKKKWVCAQSRTAIVSWPLVEKNNTRFDAAVEAVRITHKSRPCWTLIDTTLISESADPARDTASPQRRVAHHHISAVQLFGLSEDTIVLYA